MEADIKAGKYLEHGEYEGNLYGTKIDSILEVVQTGRTCILDVNPQVSCIEFQSCWGKFCLSILGMGSVFYQGGVVVLSTLLWVYN